MVMATLELIPSSTSFTQGQNLSVVLRADFSSSVLGAAVLRLKIPGSGFANIAIVSLAFTNATDVFVSTPPASPLSPIEVDCARAAGAAGPTDLLRIDCTISGYRAFT